MGKRIIDIKSLISLTIFGTIFSSACQNGVNTSFEDSVEPYRVLQAVDNTLKRNDDC